MKKLIYVLIGFLLATGVFILVYKLFLAPDETAVKGPQAPTHENKTTSKNKSVDQKNAGTTNQVANSNTSRNADGSAKTPENVTEPTYVNGVLIVNKKHPLPATYNQGEDPTARAQVNKLIADMQKQGMNVSNQTSGFRSYQYQGTLYNNYVASHGKAQADTFSARPGYSEHQSGLAFDLIDNQGQLLGAPGTNSASIAAADWLANNAHNYGFIVRYKKEFSQETGYQDETWHIRYVGDEIARKIYNENISLERYLGVEGGDYQ